MLNIGNNKPSLYDLLVLYATRIEYISIPGHSYSGEGRNENENGALVSRLVNNAYVMESICLEFNQHKHNKQP